MGSFFHEFTGHPAGSTLHYETMWVYPGLAKKAIWTSTLLEF
jgi:hypothetical protein